MVPKIFLLLIAFQVHAPLVEERNNISYQEATGNSRLLSSLTTNNHRIRELGKAIVLLIIFGHIFGNTPGNHTDIFPLGISSSIFPYTPSESEEQNCSDTCDICTNDPNNIRIKDNYIRNAYIIDAYIIDADIIDAYIRDAEIDAHIRNAHIRNAHIRAAYIRGAYIRDAYIRFIKMNPKRYEENFQQISANLNNLSTI